MENFAGADLRKRVTQLAILSGNRLRALAGGDGRFGGLNDLVSISPSDARDSVYARFAVVRRARMAGRWR